MESWPKKYAKAEYAYDPNPLLTFEYLEAAWGNLVVDRPDMTLNEFLRLVGKDELIEESPSDEAE
jgi:hypothetical protein